ncbi:MAG: PAS domain S-box protein [Verrucomicrobiales bacterium]
MTEIDSSFKSCPADPGIFRAIVESVVNGIVMTDREGRITLLNSQAEKYFGYDREELLGKPIEILVPESGRSSHVSHRKTYHKDPRAREMGVGRDLYGRRKDGSEFPVEIGLSPVEAGDGPFVLAVIVDITERRMLEERIAAISESEKRRIGEEIHDDLCQQLAGIGCISKALENRITERSPQDAEDLGELGRMIANAHARAREISRGLVTGTLCSEGLADALRNLGSSTETVFEVDCEVDCEVDVPVELLEFSLHIYRIAQEAIGNAVRHGKAGKIRISLRGDRQRLVLLVEDDGGGIAGDAIERHGTGLLNMKNRAKMLGGKLRVGPREGGGTFVSCNVPLPHGVRK